MKRALFLVTILAGWSWADIAVTQGSGKTVATITTGGREFQQISAQLDASSNTVSNPGNAFLMTSTGAFNAVNQIVGVTGSTGSVGYGVGMASLPVAIQTLGPSVYQGILITSNSVVVSSNIFDYSNVTFTLYPSSTSGNVVAFEASADSGTSWVPITAVQLGAEVLSSSYTLTGTTTSWTADLPGATNFRIRLARWFVGTASATIIPFALPSNQDTLATLAVETYQNGNASPNIVGYTAGGSSVPVNILNQPTITNTGFNSWIVNSSTGGTQPVSGTVTANAGTGNFTITNPGNANLFTSTGTFTVQNPGNANLVTSTNTVVLSTLTVQGNAYVGAVPTGAPLQLGVEVASTTLPTAQADGTMTYLMGNTIGQMSVTGLPWGLAKSTFSTTVFPSTQILISSAAAGSFNVLCDCIFANTSATATDVLLTSIGNFAAVNDQVDIEIPATDTRGAKVGPFCSNPITRSIVSGQINVKATAAVTSINLSCHYVALKG